MMNYNKELSHSQDLKKYGKIKKKISIDSSCDYTKDQSLLSN